MRVLAIGDIHGCLFHLNDLLDVVKPASNDLIITLGDYVDRGPESRGVLESLIRMKASGMNLICLRGNHELLMVDARDGGSAERNMWMSVGGVQTLGSYGLGNGRSGSLDDVPDQHWDLLDHGLVDYHLVDRFIFVHATVLTEYDMDEQPDHALFWEFLPDTMRHFTGKQVICGHSAQKTGHPKVIPGAVCIDTFAHGGGWLTCLDVMTGQYWQVNGMGRSRESAISFLD